MRIENRLHKDRRPNATVDFEAGLVEEATSAEIFAAAVWGIVMENMSSAVRAVLSNYATFTGRASRPEYWWWALSVFIVLLVAGLLDAFLVAPMLGFGVEDENSGQPLSFIISVAILIPNIAVGVRRLHDTGRTGWWLLISLVPIIGFLVLLYFFVQPSEEDDNQYGPRPTWSP